MARHIYRDRVVKVIQEQVEVSRELGSPPNEIKFNVLSGNVRGFPIVVGQPPEGRRYEFVRLDPEELDLAWKEATNG